MAYGKVLITGLGFGFLLNTLINKKEVKEVFEKDEQELIDLFEEKLKNNTKLSSIFLASKLSDNLKSKKSHKKSKI